MVLSNVPMFTQAIATTFAKTTAANTSRTAPTNQVTLVTAGSQGTLVSQVTAKWVATNVAGLVMLWGYDGANYWLYGEYPTTAVTVSATVPGFTLVIPLQNFILASGQSLVASNYIAETVIFTTFAENY
jgi:hypothetical protein